MIFISDIDGTIADMQHRLPLIQCPSPDWAAFFKACVDDKPILDVIQMLFTLRSVGHQIIYLSSRSDEVMTETIQWLFKHECPAGPLYMRRAGDHRQSSVVKRELLDELIDRYPVETIAGVFDDRDAEVKMYRERGLRVYQVANGEF